MAVGMESIDAPESGSTRIKIVELLEAGETPSWTTSFGMMERIVMLPAVSGFGDELLCLVHTAWKWSVLWQPRHSLPKAGQSSLA
jgi:hypothetical protein